MHVKDLTGRFPDESREEFSTRRIRELTLIIERLSARLDKIEGRIGSVEWHPLEKS